MAMNVNLVFASLNAKTEEMLEQQKQLQTFQSLVVLPVKVISLNRHKQFVKLGK